MIEWKLFWISSTPIRLGKMSTWDSVGGQQWVCGRIIQLIFRGHEITWALLNSWTQTEKHLKMPKEKSVNPVQAQRKAEKAKAIKKGKPSPPIPQPPPGSTLFLRPSHLVISRLLYCDFYFSMLTPHPPPHRQSRSPNAPQWKALTSQPGPSAKAARRPQGYWE